MNLRLAVSLLEPAVCRVAADQEVLTGMGRSLKKIGGRWKPRSEPDSGATLHRALDPGVNCIDTAAGYGEGKREHLQESGAQIAETSPQAINPLAAHAVRQRAGALRMDAKSGHQKAAHQRART